MTAVRPVHSRPMARIGGTLVVADLHIGIERTLAMKGFKMPSATQSIVEAIVAHPGKRLVILGDIKDQLATTSPGLEGELLWACERLASAFPEVVLVRGNHDAGLPRSLQRHIRVEPASGIVESGIRLMHGHTKPTEEALDAGTLAVAHTHPRVELVDGIGKSSFEACWARFPARRGAVEGSRLRRVVVFPACNPLCGGTPVNRLAEPLLGPALSESLIDREKGRVHLLDGTDLGSVSALAVPGERVRHWRRPGTDRHSAKPRTSYWDARRTKR